MTDPAGRPASRGGSVAYRGRPAVTEEASRGHRRHPDVAHRHLHRRRLPARRQRRAVHHREPGDGSPAGRDRGRRHARRRPGRRVRAGGVRRRPLGGPLPGRPQGDAAAADKLFDSIAPTGPDALGMILREPIGVVAAVLPWNFPIMMAAWKAAPALAAGNSLIIKPAELTSLSTIRLAELAAEAGLPDGVLNVVPGLGPTAGQALGRHNGVDALSFTGSTEVGRLFLRYASESNLKEIVLECGGKSPHVVMADARDLDLVAENIAFAGFTNMGENCTCGSRVIVHRSVRDDLLERMIAKTGEWTVGDPSDPDTRIGPMIEAPHLAKVMSYIEAGKREGAHVVVGGDRALPDTGGYFVEP